MVTAPPGPEFALLVEASRWPRPEGYADRLRALAANVTNWDLFLKLIARHHVAGLGQDALSRISNELPDRVAASLSRSAQGDAAHELVQVAETVSLVQALSDAGIDCIVMKGVTLAKALYGRFGLRYSVDIDLLVAPEQASPAARTLSNLGYECADSLAIDTSETIRERQRCYKEIAFVNPKSSLVVELHWRLFDNRHVLPGIVRTEPVSLTLLPGVDVPALAPDAAELYMCCHGSEHAWARLKWLADLNAALAKAPDRAAQLYATSRKLRRQRLIGPGLWLVNRIYGGVLPSAVALDMAGDWRMRFLAQTALNALVGNDDGAELEETPLGTTRKNLSHYLVTNDPRHWLAEAKFDFRHRNPGDQGPTVRRRVTSVWQFFTATHARAENA